MRWVYLCRYIRQYIPFSVIPFKAILGVLYGLLVVTISMLAVIVYRNNIDSVQNSAWVKRTRDIIELTHELTEKYTAIHMESTSYLMTRNETPLKAYRVARTQLDENLGRLRNLIADNPRQVSRVDSLEGLLKRLTHHADSTVSLIPTHAMTREEIATSIQIKKSYRVPIDKMVESIREEEKQFLAVREAALEKSIAARNYTFILMVAGFAFLLASSFLIIRHNFNKRVRSEKELKIANDLFSRLFTSNPVGGVICRKSDSAVVKFNQSYADITGETDDQILGKPPSFFANLSPAQRDEINDAFSKDVVLRDMEVELRRNGVDTMWLSISMVAVEVDKQPCMRFTVQNITPHKRAEMNIKSALAAEMELSKLKSDFVTLASHEFRTPLTSIASSASLLETIAVAEPEKQRLSKHVSRIKASVATLTSILNKFMSVVKIDDGSVAPNFETINLVECCEQICKAMKAASKPGQQIVFEHQGDQYVFLDRSLFEIILTNLLNNAVKYSPENSKVDLISRLNSHLEITVQDQGIGIPLHDQKNLFQRFFRSSNSENIQGIGVGLYVARHYVEKMNGSITAESEPGKGTKFHVVFRTPFAPAA
ncbi:MAG TPA: ATP-binding protein [Cyclobacteriaceae bacterium]|nr:ATP-binding protein [Cyclobacteriaceae bacterium]